MHLTSRKDWFIFLLRLLGLFWIPTGLIIMFGDGIWRWEDFCKIVCKSPHGLATIIFAICLYQCFYFWFVRMLPATYDIKWMFMVGGYLSKTNNQYQLVNCAGQKAWFWVATVGGFFMILTGASMFYLDYNISSLEKLYKE